MKIRKSIPSDLDNIKEIEKTNYGYILTEELINDSLHTHFILEDDSFIGYISLWHDDNKAQIESIIVNIKNKGYGQKLLKYALDYLNGYVITLEVRKSNYIAIHVYEKFGFKTITIRKNYYKNNEDALLMLREC
ncbi:MAG: GNAT family N-acetyltransferase [bacterium]|nr:GNAT family N-acetyltransferase [bacterium]